MFLHDFHKLGHLGILFVPTEVVQDIVFGLFVGVHGVDEGEGLVHANVAVPEKLAAEAKPVVETQRLAQLFGLLALQGLFECQGRGGCVFGVFIVVVLVFFPFFV